jgi:hypothetical protein
VAAAWAMFARVVTSSSSMGRRQSMRPVSVMKARWQATSDGPVGTQGSTLSSVAGSEMTAEAMALAEAS